MISELRNIPAPAKLNLFLHVTGRRADGYHLLETVFELVDLADTMHFRLREDGRVLRAGRIAGVPEEHDLSVRAARLLAEATGCRLGVEIEVEKRIPMGGGMGGGSSDAATTLLALNRLWGLGLDRRALMRIGLRLGADVPVFVYGRAAYATGVGERLRPCPQPARAYVLVAPPAHVPTAQVFGAPELTRNTKPLKIVGLSRGWSVFRGRNDLQSVVCARHPAVRLALEGLRQAARDAGVDPVAARMTGSGACVFLPCGDEASALRVRDRLAAAGSGRRSVGSALVVRSLARHPLGEWAFARGQ